MERSWSLIVKCASFPYLNLPHMPFRQWPAPCRRSTQTTYRSPSLWVVLFWRMHGKLVSYVLYVLDERSHIDHAPVLLHIHRSFFAQAIIESPVNPLKSQYAQSFLAAYRASSTILRTIRAQYANTPHLCARFWSIWQYGFSAAVRRSFVYNSCSLTVL